jgi:hypothetical protein
LAVFADRVLCEVHVTSGGESAVRLWEYDGTGAPTPVPVDAPYDSHVWLDIFEQDFVLTSDRFSFIAVDTTVGYWAAQYLWTYDGLGPPVKVETPSYVESIRPHGGGLLLHAADGRTSWTVVGGGQPQTLFTASDLGLDWLRLPAFLDGDVWLSGYQSSVGAELWRVPSGGTIGLVTDFYPGTLCQCDCGD